MLNITGYQGNGNLKREYIILYLSNWKSYKGLIIGYVGESEEYWEYLGIINKNILVLYLENIIQIFLKLIEYQ